MLLITLTSKDILKWGMRPRELNASKPRGGEGATLKSLNLWFGSFVYCLTAFGPVELRGDAHASITVFGPEGGLVLQRGAAREEGVL